MEKKLRQQYGLVAFGVTLFALLTNLDRVVAFLKNVGALMLPVAAGSLLAFILNVPMHGFEKILNSWAICCGN